MREKLESVGVSSATAAQFTKLLVELDLLSEGRVSNLLTVSENMDKAERRQLAEQLYAHLVYWLGEFNNNNNGNMFQFIVRLLTVVQCYMHRFGR